MSGPGRMIVFLVLIAVGAIVGQWQPQLAQAQTKALRLQLNWFHDPTFAAAYILQQQKRDAVQILEGGPSIFPVANLRTGQADVAIVGFDVLIRAIDEEIGLGRNISFKVLGVDFQRNPVGYVLHPDVGNQLGMTENLWSVMSERERNKWVFDQLRASRLKVGDKVGTETTAVWLAWNNAQAQPVNVAPVSVGFDPSVVLQKPLLIYPVYLNEEPFKLREKIGRLPLIFDPAADHVTMYGNVLATTRDTISRHGNLISQLSAAYFAAWLKVRDDMSNTNELVRRYYKDSSPETVRLQLEKTVEFVYYGNVQPGTVDKTTDGRLEQSIRILHNAKAVSSKITLETLRGVFN